MKKYISIPNCLTAARLLGAVIMMFISAMTPLFLVVYAISGLTDAVDGYAARKLGGETEFGSKLDSVSDLAFYSVMLIKTFPFLYAELPHLIWWFVLSVMAFRLLIYIVNAAVKKELLSSHSYLNKASGFMLFCLPFIVGSDFLTPYSWMLVGVCWVAAFWEVTYSIYHAHFKKDK